MYARTIALKSSLCCVAAAIALAPLASLAQSTAVNGKQNAARPATSLAQAEKPNTKPADLRAAYDEAFKATMDKPSEPVVLLKFAEIAVELGDLEGAISVLERLLLINGDQPAVKLELGVLYYRLGSTEVARSYLQGARNSGSANDDIRRRAETYLKEEVKR